MTTYLDAILARHREVAASDNRSLDALIGEARDLAPVRGFRDALVASERLAVISEIKRRSPSKGDLHGDLDRDLVLGAGVGLQGNADRLPFQGAQAGVLVGGHHHASAPGLRGDRRGRG